ncbi:MAG: Stk1 family PASTA domain-containing Ser/Thr kinase [Symbiobacteriia bacterium]
MSKNMDSLLGRLLGNRYEIQERIGGGGFALVYMAMDTFLHRQVAVKVLRQQFTTDDDFVRRFRREAQAAASLSHPNVVSIYDVGQEDDVYYIVMEYVDGQTLKEKIETEAPLPVPVAVRLAVQILDALEHAHFAKIVHRDIKPHNILLTKNGRVKVTDFGIARAAATTTLTHTGSIVGSAHYFSPEQARGGFTGEKSDIYSVGVVLYEMLTGHVPFEGDSPISVAIKHIQEEGVPVSQLNPEVPLELQEIVTRAMQKDQSLRYQSAGEMTADLNRFLKDFSEGRTQKIDPAAVQRPYFGDPEAVDAVVNGDPDLRDTIQLEDRQVRAVRRAAGEGRRRSRTVLLWAVAFLAMVALGMLLSWAFSRWLNTPTVVVPNVVGLQQVEAQNRLRESKLTYDVVATPPDPSHPAGEVIQQDPVATTMVKQGRKVLLSVSRGPEQLVMPDVVGKTLQDAQTVLANAGFSVGRTETHDDPTRPENTVISQSLAPNKLYPGNTPVDLVISSGKAAVVTPSLVGQDLTQAQATLDRIKLKVGKVTPVTDPTFGPGQVVKQDPLPNTSVTEGSSVDLWINQPNNARQATLQFVVPAPSPPAPGPVLVEVVVADSRGRATQYRHLHQPGESLPVPISWVGPGTVYIYVNGNLAQQQSLPS